MMVRLRASAPEKCIQLGPCRLHFRLPQQGPDPTRELLAAPIRCQDVERFTDQLVTRVTEKRLDVSVDVRDVSIAFHDENRFGGALGNVRRLRCSLAPSIVLN